MVTLARLSLSVGGIEQRRRQHSWSCTRPQMNNHSQRPNVLTAVTAKRYMTPGARVFDTVAVVTFPTLITSG